MLKKILILAATLAVLAAACGDDSGGDDGGGASTVALPVCLDFQALYALTGPESTGFTNWSDATDLATAAVDGHRPAQRRGRA